MKELALHILDLSENALRAGATELGITLERDEAADTLTVLISDNGRGMSPEVLARVSDPFYTTKTTRRTGLGIPLAANAAQRAGGSFSITSQEGMGTCITAVFQHSHIDRQPLGDVAGTVAALLLASPDIELRFVCRSGAREYSFNTSQLREQLDGVPLNHVAVLSVLRDNIKKNVRELCGP
ncbi:ATP-binding protein [Desulfococcus sp.]|uniref:ATP-binding protein n=1 Tax=Desulfococcus sp. TaxID=2025834 RepID=UPI0035947F96